MKKHFTKSIAIILVIFFLFMFSACGCEHQWENATCLAPKTCSLCGDTEGELAKHEFTEATCTEPKTCIVCKQTLGKAKGHNLQDATCTSPETCTDCSFTTGEALGHNWEPATYEKPSTCSVCGATSGEKLTPPSEWGFYNLDEMDYALLPLSGELKFAGDTDRISISENLQNIENGFVIVNGTIKTFKNGYVYKNSFTYENGSFSFTNLLNPKPYQIIDNNNATVDSESFSILERRTYGTNVIFKMTPGLIDYSFGYHIPYSCIDWEKGAEKCFGNRYKLYLKK